MYSHLKKRLFSNRKIYTACTYGCTMVILDRVRGWLLFFCGSLWKLSLARFGDHKELPCATRKHAVRPVLFNYFKCVCGDNWTEYLLGHVEILQVNGVLTMTQAYGWGVDWVGQNIGDILKKAGRRGAGSGRGVLRTLAGSSKQMDNEILNFNLFISDHGVQRLNCIRVSLTWKLLASEVKEVYRLQYFCIVYNKIDIYFNIFGSI